MLKNFKDPIAPKGTKATNVPKDLYTPNSPNSIL